MRFTLATLATVAFALGAQAADYRLTYKLPADTTVDAFCSTWESKCSTFVHENYSGQTPSSYCYKGTSDGTVNIYCNGHTISTHTTDLADSLDLTEA